MIEFKNVTKKYDSKTTALSDVNISIEKGEFVFVVGSSGAGKSTFLKLMMREEVPSSGTITIDGYNLNKMKKRQIPKFRRKLGIVFQDFRLIPTMTVFDNVAFAMRVIGTKEKKIRRRVPYLLSLMGLSEKIRNYPRELSGGEQQRVALARALANDADIIIADEPTGNVDPQMSYEIVDLLMRLNEAGTTVIMVTHEHSLVRCFDKRVIILDKGEIVSDGGISDLNAAQGHINPASEIASQYSDARGAEDYSVFSKTPSEPQGIQISQNAKEIKLDIIDTTVNEVIFEDISSSEKETDVSVQEEIKAEEYSLSGKDAPEFNLPEIPNTDNVSVIEEAEEMSDSEDVIDFSLSGADAPEFNLPEIPTADDSSNTPVEYEDISSGGVIDD